MGSAAKRAHVAGPLAESLAVALLAEGGWYADFSAADDHVVVFSGQVFRYQRGDLDGRKRPWTTAGRWVYRNTNWTGQTDAASGPLALPAVPWSSRGQAA